MIALEAHQTSPRRIVEQRHFSTWLWAELKRREWTQAEFARRLGVGTGTVSRWMDGRRPDTDYIDRIAELLHADYDMLLSLSGHRPRDLGVDPNSPPERLYAMLKRIDWSDPQREHLIDALLTQMLDFDRESRKNT